VNVTTFLSFVEVKVSNCKFASKDVTDNDFILAFDFSYHLEIDEWQGFNAFFLFIKFMFLISVVGKNSFVKSLSLGFLHGAILIQSFTIKTSFHSFRSGLIEIWKLLESILVYPSTLHHVLTELYDGHDIFSSNFLWGLVHFVHLTQHHCLRKHNINVRWNSSKDRIDVLSNTLVLFIFLGKEVIHVCHKEANWFDRYLRSGTLIFRLFWNDVLNLVFLF